MRIRRATEGDIAPLLQLIAVLNREEPNNAMSVMSAGFLRRQLFRRTPPAFSCVFAEEDDGGSLVGFAAYWATASDDGVPPTGPTMRVMAMFVAPTARSQRIADALLSAVAREALTLKCSALAWRNWTPEAELFSARLETRVDAAGTEYRLAAEALPQLARGSRGGASS